MVKLKLKEKDKLIRKERRFLWKIKFSRKYLYILPIFMALFSPIKKFMVLSFWWIKNVLWIISFSIYKILGFKIWYIDDFIVNKN